MALNLKIENETSLPDGGPLGITVSGKRSIDIGRDSHLDWTLPNLTRQIFSKHAEIRYQDGGYWLQRRRPPHAGAAPLGNGDRFTIGHYIIDVALDAEPTDSPPLQHIRSLVRAGRLKQAAAVCAYLLPRREAVWWDCRSLKILTLKLPADEAPLLKAAEEWVGVPEEEQRVIVLERGIRSNANWPSTWLALAAGWSGGNVLLGMQATAQAPPQQTARAVRAALLTAVAYLAPAQRTSSLLACMEGPYPDSG